MISRRRGGASRIMGAGAVMVIGAVALMAAACGGSSSSNTPTSAPPTTAPATATVAAPPTASSTESSSTTGASTGGGTATVNIASSGTSRFVDDKGMSLYVFQKDTPNSGKSACSGGCSTAWPALTVPAGTQPTPGQGVDGLATITRDDGTMQVTYDGLPLYYYGGDSAPGDTMGMNIPNWALATP